jgi:RNA polymerase sigma factor (sigma-70 family)
MSAQPEDARPEFIPTRETLLSRLKDAEDHESWRRFFDTYWKLIYSVARKAGLCDADAQEVVQETVISVSNHIGRFRYDPKVCSFKTWLMQVTRSRISNQFRKQKARSRIRGLDDQTDRTALIEQVPDERIKTLDTLWEEEWEKNVMDAAVDRVKRRVRAEQFQLFDFTVLRDFPVPKVAEMFGVSRTRVYLARHRITKMVRAEAKKLEHEVE